MKAGWQEKPLGEVCAFVNRGISPKYVDKGGVCVLNQKCVRDHAVSFELSRRHDVVAKVVSAERYIQLGDVLVNSTGTGTLGRVAQVRDVPEEPSTVDSHVTIVRPKPDLFHLDFFGYMLIKIEDEIKEAGDGCGGQTELARSALAERFIVSYPTSISEQRRIVGILDAAFDGIATATANAEQNLKNARALFDSHLQSVFTQRGEGWVDTSLSDLCDIKHGFAFDGADFSSDVPKGKPIVITPGNFTEDGQLLFNEKNTKRFSGEPSGAFRFDIGDLVIVMTDLSSKMKILGKPAFVDTENVLHNQRIGRVVFRSDAVEKRFVYYFLMSDDFLKNIKLTATGTMVKHTAPSRILSNVISFPAEREEQLQLVAKLDALREETQRLESLYRRKLAALAELKQSLLHQAFNGML